jgi:hypothetical protein
MDRELVEGSDDYSPEFEWPGEDFLQDTQHDSWSEPTTPSRRKRPPVLRLLVVTSSILPPQQILVILDDYSQVRIGRDCAPSGSSEPRIRLKEMAVSKVHACIYLDEEADSGKGSWGLVDMGSMHGTYVKSTVGPSANAVGGVGTRLSASRVASIPRTLQHLDEVTIGSTTFCVHIHHDGRPCDQCLPKGGDKVPLFQSARKDTLKRRRDLSVALVEVEKDPKKALTALKRNLLHRHSQDPPQKLDAVSSAAYVDRSARRRVLYPLSHGDSPGVPTPLIITSRSSSPAASAPSRRQRTPPSVSISEPLPTTNIGHQLLLKQGWQPGESLGLVPVPGSLVEPLDLVTKRSRVGLGMQVDESNDLHSSKENARRKRWDRLKLDEK